MPFPPINNEKHITFRDIGMYHMNNDRKIEEMKVKKL